MVTLPHTLANDTAADADEVQANLDAIVSALADIRNADVADDAAIDRSKLAQGYFAPEVNVQVVPYNGAAANYASQTTSPMPTTMTTIARHRVVVPAGEVQWLAEVDIYVDAHSGSTTDPEIRIDVDGNTVGGASVPITAAGWYRLRIGSTPYASPVYPVGSGSVIEIKAYDGGTDGELAGVNAILRFKRSLVA